MDFQLSVFGGSGWTWSEKRQEFYFHQFHKKQPDFNYENPAIVQELKVNCIYLNINIHSWKGFFLTNPFN